MKLYAVKIICKVIIEAESPDDAYKIAEHQGKEILENESENYPAGFQFSVDKPIIFRNDLDTNWSQEGVPGWDLDCLPYRSASREGAPDKMIWELIDY